MQIRTLNNTMEKLTEMPVSRKIEMQATKKILAIIGVFFFVNLFIGIAGHIGKYCSFSSRIILVNISDMLSVLNCCVNVIIYAIFDPKFRQIFLELFFSSSQTNKNKMNLINCN